MIVKSYEPIRPKASVHFKILPASPWPDHPAALLSARAGVFTNNGNQLCCFYCEFIADKNKGWAQLLGCWDTGVHLLKQFKPRISHNNSELL